MPWPVVFYRQADGVEPADVFIEQQSAAAQAAIDNYIERLAILGPALGFPSTSQVDGELRELRPDLGNVHFRLLYRRTDNIFVILHAFIKPGRSLLNRRSRSPTDDGPTSRLGWTRCLAGRHEPSATMPPMVDRLIRSGMFRIYTAIGTSRDS